MTCIADANVLFPLLVRQHIAHDTAQTWWHEQRDRTVRVCLLTRIAVLRLLTNRVAMNGEAVKPLQAMSAWRRLAEDPRAHYVEPDISAHEHHFAAYVAGREPSPNLWTDAWLAALAVSLDYEMTTFNRGFRSFRGLRVRLLSAPHG